jgi:hypothetical protein
MLSIKDGRPIARFVKTDKYKGEILYINNSDDKTKAINDTLEFNDAEIKESLINNSNKRNGRERLQEIDLIRKAIKRGVEPIEDKYNEIYQKLKKKIDDNLGKEISVNTGNLQQIPRDDTRECLYVSAPSGSGKSTYVSNYASEYLKMFPKNKLIVFSKLDDDDAIDRLNPLRITIDEELLDNGIKIEDLSNSLVIFDDTDTIQDKKLLDYINHLKNDILQTGRHFNIYLCITSHLINNYKSTRIVMNESSSITIFPSSGSAYAISYALKNYVGLSKEDIAKIFKLPSRWITIFKNYPQCVLYEKGCYLLSKN